MLSCSFSEGQEFQRHARVDIIVVVFVEKLARGKSRATLADRPRRQQSSAKHGLCLGLLLTQLDYQLRSTPLDRIIHIHRAVKYTVLHLSSIYNVYTLTNILFYSIILINMKLASHESTLKYENSDITYIILTIYRCSQYNYQSKATEFKFS